MALGAEPRLGVLNIPLKASGAVRFGLSYFGAGESRWSRAVSEIVAQTTIDDLVTALALDGVDFIKADIEGAKLRLLEGAQHTLSRFHPRLLIELTNAHLSRVGDTLVTGFAFLAAHGYRAFALDSSGSFSPVVAPRDGDFWFFAADDPDIGLANTEGAAESGGLS